jgi:enamine deaminase RidA (YjgF/YER057c/UK114 family)
MMNGNPNTERVYPALLAILVATLMLPGAANSQDAGAVTREYLTLDWTEGRAFSPAVVTQGGKTVWLAGVTAPFDADGNSLAGDLEAQTHEIFRVIAERLATYGGTLADIVTMTVYIGDTRYGDPFIDIRATKFEAGHYPSSALITVVGFALPGILLEVKATAVVSAE